MATNVSKKTDECESAGIHLRRWRQHRRLSQLELAMRAEVSGRHLSFIESGRAQPSRQMILRLATQLAIPARQVNEILQAGGFANAYPQYDQADERMELPLRAVQKVLDAHDIYPAFAVNWRWEIVANNRAFELFYEGVDPALLQAPMNVLRLCLHPNGVAPRILNLEEMAQFIFARLDREIERTADMSLVALKEELRSYASEAKIEDADHQAMKDVVVPLRLHSEHGVMALFGMITVFGTPNDVTLSELALETFFPADKATEHILAARRPESL